MSWFLLLVGVVLLTWGLAWVFRYVQIGVPQPIGGLESVLIGLLRQCDVGGELTLRVPRLLDPIRFRKYTQSSGEYGARLVVSDHEISPKRFEDIVDFLLWRVKELGGERIQRDSDIYRSLEIDFHMDTAEAARVVMDLLQRIYNLSHDDCVRVRLDDA